MHTDSPAMRVRYTAHTARSKTTRHSTAATTALLPQPTTTTTHDHGYYHDYYTIASTTYYGSCHHCHARPAGPTLTEQQPILHKIGQAKTQLAAPPCPGPHFVARTGHRGDERNRGLLGHDHHHHSIIWPRPLSHHMAAIGLIVARVTQRLLLSGSLRPLFLLLLLQPRCRLPVSPFCT